MTLLHPVSQCCLALPPFNVSTGWEQLTCLYSQVLIHMMIGAMWMSHSCLVPGTMLAHRRYSRNICWRNEWMHNFILADPCYNNRKKARSWTYDLEKHFHIDLSSVKFHASCQERKVLRFHWGEVDRAAVLFSMILTCATGWTTFILGNTFKTERIKIFIFSFFLMSAR